MSCLQSGEILCGPLLIRPSGRLPKGHPIDGHDHTFDHVTFVFFGSIRVRATLPDGTQVDNVYHAGDFVNIAAKVRHAIEALEEGTLYACVYPHRTPDGAISERPTGWQAAYQ